MNVDVTAHVQKYLGSRDAEARYASFDYCFNYFQSFRERGAIDDLLAPDHEEMSCLQLAFYLASWGMLRGSTDLLRRRAAYHRRILRAIVGMPREIWTIDVENYDRDTIDLL